MTREEKLEAVDAQLNRLETFKSMLFIYPKNDRKAIRAKAQEIVGLRNRMAGCLQIISNAPNGSTLKANAESGFDDSFSDIQAARTQFLALIGHS